MNEERNWNDAIESISGCAFRRPIVTVGKIYEDENFSGANTKIVLQAGECKSFYPDDWWNNRLSSIKIIQGCMKLYSQSNCLGASLDTRTAKAFSGTEWNKLISSFSPCT